MRKNNNGETLMSRGRAIYLKTAAIMTALYCTVVCAVPAFATTNTIINGVSNGAKQIWNILVGIVAPIAAVALAVCAVKILWGGQRAAEEAKSTAVKIVIGVAIVLLAPSIVAAVKGWFNKASWNFS